MPLCMIFVGHFETENPPRLGGLLRDQLLCCGPAAFQLIAVFICIDIYIYI